MKKFINFIKKPKNLYLSIAVMLVVVMGLTSISFSYYIEDSTNSNQSFQLNKIDTFIQSDYLTSDELTIPAGESVTVDLNVINNNEFGNLFKLYYEGDGVTYKVDKEVNEIISSKFVLNYNVTFTNTTNDLKTIKIGIINGYLGTEVNVPGTQIK